MQFYYDEKFVKIVGFHILDQSLTRVYIIIENQELNASY